MGAIAFLLICVIMMVDVATTIDKKHNPNRRKQQMDDILHALYNILILATGFSAVICASLTAVALINLVSSSMLTYRDDRLLLAWALPSGLFFSGLLMVMLGWTQVRNHISVQEILCSANCATATDVSCWCQLRIPINFGAATQPITGGDIQYYKGTEVSPRCISSPSGFCRE